MSDEMSLEERIHKSHKFIEECFTKDKIIRQIQNCLRKTYFKKRINNEKDLREYYMEVIFDMESNLKILRSLLNEDYLDILLKISESDLFQTYIYEKTTGIETFKIGQLLSFFCLEIESLDKAIEIILKTKITQKNQRSHYTQKNVKLKKIVESIISNKPRDERKLINNLAKKEFSSFLEEINSQTKDSCSDEIIPFNVYRPDILNIGCSNSSEFIDINLNCKWNNKLTIDKEIIDIIRYLKVEHSYGDYKTEFLNEFEFKKVVGEQEYLFYLSHLMEILISRCRIKRGKNQYEKLYHYFSSLEALDQGIILFDELRVVEENDNPLDNFMIGNYTTDSCIEGPKGLYKEGALLGELCPSVYKLILQSYYDNIFKDKIGVAYILKCKDNDTKDYVWMIDGVETGIAVSLMEDQDLWKNCFHQGIYNAAKNAGIERIIFNMNVKNRRAKEFVRWLKTRKELYTKDGQKQFKYSLTLLDSKDGVIQSLADFGGKYYAEAWYDKDDKNAFNCCDSEYLGKKVKGIEVHIT